MNEIDEKRTETVMIELNRRDERLELELLEVITCKGMNMNTSKMTVDSSDEVTPYTFP